MNVGHSRAAYGMIWLVFDVEGVRVPVRSRRPTASQWLSGARPRTLPAAIAPVLAGTGVAAATNQAVWWRALLALVAVLGTAYVQTRAVTTRRARAVTLAAAGVVGVADGERLGPLPLRNECRAGALRVLAPAGSHRT